MWPTRSTRGSAACSEGTGSKPSTHGTAGLCVMEVFHVAIFTA